MVKSSEEQLKHRGYIHENDLLNYKDYGISELMELLNSQNPQEGTIAVRLLSNLMIDDDQKAMFLCQKLYNENKLYTKIEICNTLAKMGVCAARVMSTYLGKIGNNQYTELPEGEFKKNSYPLPRDIISRTLAHMGKEVLPYLLQVLESGSRPAIREAIDAIGFICFYENADFPLGHLITCLNQYGDDKIIRWKIVRAFGSFNNVQVIDLLNIIKVCEIEKRIQKEAERSLRIMKQSKTTFV